MKSEIYTLKWNERGTEKTEDVEGLSQAEARAIEIAKTVADGSVNATDESGESAFNVD